MTISDIVIQLNVRSFLNKHVPSNLLETQKLLPFALKAITLGTSLHHKKEYFAFGFAIGVLTRFITNQDFRLNKINQSIDKDPLNFLKVSILGTAILYPNSFGIGAAIAGFYSGIQVAKFCK